MNLFTTYGAKELNIKGSRKSEKKNRRERRRRRRGIFQMVKAVNPKKRVLLYV